MQIWFAEIKELESLNTSIKGRVPELEKELERLVKADDENMILLYSRRCLEVIITDLCENELKRPRGSEPLKGIIDKLSHEKKVPSNIIASMEGLNTLSTFGTHPKDFDPEQVKPVLNNLAIIIKWYVKYKDAQTINKAKPEEVKSGGKELMDNRGDIHRPKKKLILLISGVLLVVAIVIVVLFVFNIIGSKTEIKETEKSIAVLPFTLLSNETDKQYLADGMMDAIVLHLSKIEDLRVLARTSTLQYREPDKTMTEIGRELGVSYMLEGSFQKYGDNVRLIVQLIKTEEEDHIWVNEYDRKWNDILSVQSEVAQVVARELHSVITPEEKELIEKASTTKLTAYDLYLQGNNYQEDYSKTNSLETYQKAVSLYLASIDIDSAFARAYTGLAFAYWNRYYWESYFKENFMDSCVVLANIALSFDEQLDEAYFIKGRCYELIGHIEEALENYDKTLKINPNYYGAYERKGWVLTSIKNDYVNGIDNYNNALIRIHGKERSLLLRNLAFAYKDIGFFDKARYYYDEAFTLDSNKAANFSHLYILAAVEEKLDEAMEIERKHQEIDSTYIPQSIIDYVDKDEAYNIAIRIIDYYKKSGEPNLQTSHRVGFALWRVGKIEEARKYLDQQIKYSEESIQLKRDIAHWKAAYYDLAITYAFLGNKEKAYQYLDELNKGNTCQIRFIIFLKHDPPLESIRSEERFQKILQNYEAKYLAEHERVRKWMEEQGTYLR
jgi:TolB-like protein/lipoprotein NlpI